MNGKIINMEVEDMKILNFEHVKNVCKVGQGVESCRYLAGGIRGLECMKNTSLAKSLDNRVEEGTMNARGDNCDGCKDDLSLLEEVKE